MRRSSNPLPQQLDKTLDEFLSVHMPPSSSRVPRCTGRPPNASRTCAFTPMGAPSVPSGPRRCSCAGVCGTCLSALGWCRKSRSSRSTCLRNNVRPVWSTPARPPRSSTSIAPLALSARSPDPDRPHGPHPSSLGARASRPREAGPKLHPLDH